jgi:hypothetical protein
MKLRKSVAFSIFVFSLVFIISCASTEETTDKNFLGNFLPQDLETLIGNSMTENKGKLTPHEFDLVFYPNGNAIEMTYRTGLNFIRLNLMQENREAMIEAMQKYLDDYQTDRLTKENAKKKAYFGKTQISMLWGLLAPTYYAHKVTLRFEYQYAENNKPYFIIANATTKETNDSGTAKSDGANSPANRIALSPLQCQKLIEEINQETLLGIVSKLQADADAFDIPDDSSNSVQNEKQELF